jgi:hypothetical protein
MPAAIHVSRVYSVAGVLYVQFVLMECYFAREMCFVLLYSHFLCNNNNNNNNNYCKKIIGLMRGFEGSIYRPRCGAVGCDIALQAGRSRARFPMV